MKQFHSFLSYIFLTADKSRLRAGWRLLIAVFLTVLFFNYGQAGLLARKLG